MRIELCWCIDRARPAAACGGGRRRQCRQSGNGGTANREPTRRGRLRSRQRDSAGSPTRVARRPQNGADRRYQPDGRSRARSRSAYPALLQRKADSAGLACRRRERRAQRRDVGRGAAAHRLAAARAGRRRGDRDRRERRTARAERGFDAREPASDHRASESGASRRAHSARADGGAAEPRCEIYGCVPCHVSGRCKGSRGVG